MNIAQEIIDKFGGIKRMTEIMGYRHPSRIANWKIRGKIPPKQLSKILHKAEEHGIALDADALIEKIIIHPQDS